LIRFKVVSGGRVLSRSGGGRFSSVEGEEEEEEMGEIFMGLRTEKGRWMGFGGRLDLPLLYHQR